MRRVLLIAGFVLLQTGCACFQNPHVWRCDEPEAQAPCNVPDCGGCDVCAEDWRNYTLRARLDKAMTCGSGCGPMYWGEWCYDPPKGKGCDPCDCYGNHVGPRPCKPPLVDRLRAGFQGHRICPVCPGPCVCPPVQHVEPQPWPGRIQAQPMTTMPTVTEVVEPQQ